MDEVKFNNFFEKRKQMVKLWTPAAIGLLFMLFILIAMLFIRTPNLINPKFVAQSLKNNTITDSQMIFATLALPIIVFFQFFIIFVIILLGFSVFSNEKKYIERIEFLEEEIGRQKK